MPKLSEEERILYYYGELSDVDIEAIRRQLESSEADRRAYQQLCAVLDAVSEAPAVEPPEPSENYVHELWQALEPRLGQEPVSEVHPLVDGPAVDRQALREWRFLALAATFLVSITAAFLLGRWAAPGTDLDPEPFVVAERPSDTASSDTVPSDTGPSAENRLLLLSVAEHLEHTSLLLVELSNFDTASDRALEIGPEVQRAETLLASNRLYRQAARRSEQVAIEELLGRLERLLLELARGPSRLEAEKLEHLRAQLGGDALLFEVRVLGAALKELRAPPRAPESSPLAPRAMEEAADEV